MMKLYKAAVIGCGNIGIEEKNFAKAIQPGTHAAAYNANERIILCGLADNTPSRLTVAKHYYPGIPLFSSPEKLLKETKPDIVSITTHTDSHASLATLAAKRGVKAIVCEKPIATSLSQGEKMIDACKAYNALLFINHSRRFDPLLRAWQKKINQGVLGDILQVNCLSYNGLFNNGTHTVDLLRFFLGDIESVRGWENAKTTSDPSDSNVDALLTFKNGVRATLQTLPKHYGCSDYYFYGTKGRLIINRLGYQLSHTLLVKNTLWKNRYEFAATSQKFGKPRSFMKPMVNHVIACLDKKENPLSTGQDGVEALRVLLAIAQSAKKNGAPINLL